MVSYSVKGGGLVEALKMRALPEGSNDYLALLEFLKLYRDAVQLVVNKLWSLNEIPSIKTLHKMSYSELKRYGFRAHHVKQVYTYAKTIVRASKRNGGKKPVLRRLTARVDRYDYRLDLENRTLILRIHDGRVVILKLLTSIERIEKFRGWSNYEIAIKVIENEVYVAVYFRRIVKSRKTKTITTIDVNFDNVTLAVFTSSGKLLKLKRYKTPLRKILTHRIWIERIQKRYSKSWGFVKGVREVIEKHGDRMKSIALDYAHKIGDRVAEIANEHNSTIVLENLNKLRDRANSNSLFNKKLSLWFYRKIQFTINYEALERRLEVSYINPMKTSSTCPRCESRLKDNGDRVLKCSKCDFTGDRDVVACINLFYRYSRCGVPRVALNAPKGDANLRPMQGKRDEAMKSTYIRS
ncbi:MAG: zinc ribbon domain-containing protein [Candidatus Bathyarchaeia archaeon]|nr:transposase [Candidatus Bathyarchaeota archaeon]